MRETDTGRELIVDEMIRRGGALLLAAVIGLGGCSCDKVLLEPDPQDGQVADVPKADVTSRDRELDTRTIEKDRLDLPTSPACQAGTKVCSADNWCQDKPLLQGENLNNVWGSSGSNVFAVGQGTTDCVDNGCRSTILHYDGTNWTPMATPPWGTLGGVWGTSGTDVFAVGVWCEGKWPFPYVCTSTCLHYDGTSLTDLAAVDGGLSAVWGSSPNDVFAVGAVIQHYDGTSWKSQASSATGLSSVWGSSGSDVFAVEGDANNKAVILHYDGTSWTAQTLGAAKGLYAVWGNSGTEVVAVGGSDADGNATVLHYNGTSWKPMASGTTSTLRGVWGSSGSNIFAVGDDGTVLHRCL